MVDDSRARLIAYLCQAGLSTPRANAVVDAFAHNLAEKQRAWADSFGATPAQQAVASIVREAADLIAPEAA
ncbi:hypothetical protein ACFXJO_05335 [Streptomyces lavendulae]|uniref:hypothetical protein n=1 Tax=Streptomyces lavendulae TaxID=1914 RepID=UPI0036C2817B